MSKKTQDYFATEDGFINGVWCAKGGKVALTDAQARMFLDHGRITLAKQEPAKAAKS